MGCSTRNSVHSDIKELDIKGNIAQFLIPPEHEININNMFHIVGRRNFFAPIALAHENVVFSVSLYQLQYSKRIDLMPYSLFGVLSTLDTS